jgi:hypothetical protein
LHICKPFQIVNTGTLHSVETIDKKMSGIVFFINGTSKIKDGITENQPCDVLLEEKEWQLELFLSDATHKLSILS